MAARAKRRRPERDPLELRLAYSPHRPEPRQHAYLLLDELAVREAMYGGAAGGGKSDALLMAALRYVDVPGYAALILRRSYPDLALPGAIMDRAKSWLAGTDARWSERDFRFTFPSSATLSFGYLATAHDKYRYGGAEFQFVAFDELTQFPEADYTFLFSRLRGPEIPDDAPPHVRRQRERLAQVPLRMRTASNPGGRGHAWVKRRFVERLPSPDDPEDTLERARARIFIPARLEDNPHIDQASYRQSLANLSKVERDRLERGDWDADDGTLYFPSTGIAAALALGEEYAELERRGEMPPPKGRPLGGLDFGDKTAGVMLYPLEAGGAYITGATLLEGLEPGTATPPLLELARTLPNWQGRRRVAEPLELLEGFAYDAAGLSSAKTFAKVAWRRRADLVLDRIDFNAYKREAGLYLRHLLERAAAGHTTRVLAIDPASAGELARAMGGLVKDPKDAELWVKQDDHLPDALVAAIARIAVRNRGRQPPAAKRDPRKLGPSQRA